MRIQPIWDLVTVRIPTLTLRTQSTLGTRQIVQETRQAGLGTRQCLTASTGPGLDLHRSTGGPSLMKRSRDLPVSFPYGYVLNFFWGPFKVCSSPMLKSHEVSCLPFHCCHWFTLSNISKTMHWADWSKIFMWSLHALGNKSLFEWTWSVIKNVAIPMYGKNLLETKKLGTMTLGLKDQRLRPTLFVQMIIL